jgi:hypothetical protein
MQRDVGRLSGYCLAATWLHHVHLGKVQVQISMPGVGRIVAALWSCILDGDCNPDSLCTAYTHAQVPRAPTHLAAVTCTAMTPAVTHGPGELCWYQHPPAQHQGLGTALAVAVVRSGLQVCQQEELGQDRAPPLLLGRLKTSGRPQAALLGPVVLPVRGPLQLWVVVLRARQATWLMRTWRSMVGACWPCETCENGGSTCGLMACAR